MFTWYAVRCAPRRLWIYKLHSQLQPCPSLYNRIRNIWFTQGYIEATGRPKTIPATLTRLPLTCLPHTHPCMVIISLPALFSLLKRPRLRTMYCQAGINGRGSSPDYTCVSKVWGTWILCPSAPFDSFTPQLFFAEVAQRAAFDIFHSDFIVSQKLTFILTVHDKIITRNASTAKLNVVSLPILFIGLLSPLTGFLFYFHPSHLSYPFLLSSLPTHTSPAVPVCSLQSTSCLVCP